MDCACGGKIVVLEKDLYWNPPSQRIIYCSKCQRKFTWKEYQTMRCDKLAEMMSKI